MCKLIRSSLGTYERLSMYVVWPGLVAGENELETLLLVMTKLVTVYKNDLLSKNAVSQTMSDGLV